MNTKIEEPTHWSIKQEIEDEISEPEVKLEDIAPKECHVPNLLHVCKNEVDNLEILTEEVDIKDVDLSTKLLLDSDDAINHVKLSKCITMHQKNIKHLEDMAFKCNKCEYRTKIKSYLKRHVLIHTRDKPFSCNICEYKSIKRRELVQHMASHTGDKPFKCDLCEYRTASKGNLKLHMKVHTVDKLFKCNICEYSTIHKGNLKRHVTINHWDEPFKCNICEYSSIQRREFRQHIAKHSGDKPFKCDMCEYSTALKGNLKLHMKVPVNSNTTGRTTAVTLHEQRRA